VLSLDEMGRAPLHALLDLTTEARRQMAFGHLLVIGILVDHAAVLHEPFLLRESRDYRLLH